MDIIKTGSTWVLRTAPILDITGVRLTGLTDIKFSVSRYTGGAWQWLDTADMTFRASPAGYQFTMTAVDATKVAGVYHYVIDWTTVTNVAFGDQLFFDVQQVTLTNASNPNQSSETAYGSIVDKVEANLTVATSTLATPTNITAGTITTVTNVTNAPTNGDLTATMKASVTTAATAATPTAAAVTGSVGSVAANGITSTSIAADAINAAAVKADAVTKIQNGLATAAGVTAATSTLATSAALATAQGDLTAIQGTGFTAGADDLHSARTFQGTLATSAALATAQGNITSILGFGAPPSASTISTQVNSDLTTAHGAGSYQTASTTGLAEQATLSAGILAILADVDSVPAATSAAVTSAHGAGSYVAITAAAISSQVASDLATAHGAGSWATASVAGLALEATLTAMKGATFDGSTDSLEALRNRGDAAWLTGSGWAVAGDAMTLTNGALTAVQAKIIDDATPFHGASIATILAFGAPPLAAANAAAVWATAEGGSVGDVRYAITLLRKRQTGRRKMGLDGYELIYDDDNVTVIKRALVKDIDGNIVVPAAGDPSEVSAEVDP